jgi:hypothetical protein
MKGAKVISLIFETIAKLFQLIASWIQIIFDWTDQVKATSDSAITRYAKEREIEDKIEGAKLDKQLDQRMREAGLL